MGASRAPVNRDGASLLAAHATQKRASFQNVGAPTFPTKMSVRWLDDQEFERLSRSSRRVEMISSFETSDLLNFRLRVNLLSGGRKWKVNPFGRPGPFLSCCSFLTSSLVSPERLMSSIILSIDSRFGWRAICSRVERAVIPASRLFSRRSAGMLFSVRVSVTDDLDFPSFLATSSCVYRNFSQSFSRPSASSNELRSRR